MPSLTAALLPTPTAWPTEPGLPAQAWQRPAFWYLMGGGVLVAAALLVHALRDLVAGQH
jgi:hypothetical protein